MEPTPGRKHAACDYSFRRKTLFNKGPFKDLVQSCSNSNMFPNEPTEVCTASEAFIQAIVRPLEYINSSLRVPMSWTGCSMFKAGRL